MDPVRFAVQATRLSEVTGNPANEEGDVNLWTYHSTRSIDTRSSRSTSYSLALGCVSRRLRGSVDPIILLPVKCRFGHGLCVFGHLLSSVYVLLLV